MFRMMISPRFWIAATIMLIGIGMLGPLALMLGLFFIGLAAI